MTKPEKEKVSALEAELNVEKEKVSALEAELNVEKEKVSALEAELNVEKEKVSALEPVVEQLQKENGELKAQIGKVNAAKSATKPTAKPTVPEPFELYGKVYAFKTAVFSFGGQKYIAAEQTANAGLIKQLLEVGAGVIEEKES